MASTTIKARRLLSDLFKQGVEVRFFKGPDGDMVGKIGPFNSEDGHSITADDATVRMFIRPADPVQRDMALRSAQAKRAAALVRAKRNDESEEHLTIMAFLADMDDATLIDYVVIGDTSQRMADAEREVLSHKEWEDMTAYQDSMKTFDDLREAGKAETFEGDNADPGLAKDYETLMELDEKYRTQVGDRERQLQIAQRETLHFLDRARIERRALDKRAELVGSQAFMAEYERQMLFYAVRDPDNIDTLFFDHPDELAAQPPLVQETINEALLPFITEAGEAKNSSGAADSSGSSVPPASPATTESSIPEEQIA